MFGSRWRGWCARALAVAFIGGVSARVRAHGPAPGALSVVAWEGTQARLVRLNVGLARSVPDGRFQFVCPALWGDKAGAPVAALDGERSVVAASKGLYLLGADGSARPHPDPVAVGASVDLIQTAQGVYALRIVDGHSQVLAVDAQQARVVWSDPQVFSSVAADAQRLLLLRASELDLTWQWLSLDGTAVDSGELALDLPVEYAFARASRGVGYALVLEQSRPQLGRLMAGSWAALAQGASSIAGPLAVGDVELLAVDGRLNRLAEGALTSLAEGAYVSCLGQSAPVPYACTPAGLSRVEGEALGASIFALTQLAPPDLELTTDEQMRSDCDFQWQDLRFDLLALGVEVTTEPVLKMDAGAAPAQVAGSPDAEQGAPQREDSGTPRSPRPHSGCIAASQRPARGLQGLALLLACAALLRLRARRAR